MYILPVQGKFLNVDFMIYDLYLFLIISRNFFKKQIYNEVTEDIFDMINVRIINEENEKKKGGCLYFVMSLLS